MGGYARSSRNQPGRSIGVYEYKFLVNDIWTLDPDPTCDWTQNAFGTLNSLLRVGG